MDLIGPTREGRVKCGTDEYKTTESQSQGVIAPTVVIAAAQDI